MHHLRIKVVPLLFWFLFTTLFSGVASSAEKIRVALLTTGEMQMAAYSRLFSQFESVSGVQVELDFYSDITFKKHLSSWLERGEYDLLYWQAGQRLEKLVREQTIVPIDSFINENLLTRQFRKNGLEAVTYQDRIYALPLGQYIWGFYYNKEIFRTLNISIPSTWEAFEEVLDKLKKNGITPLIQASRDDWPVLAWLDYFSLDIGGPDFRESLKTGNFGSTGQQTALIRAFERLVTNDLFFAPGHDWRWDQTIPTMLRKRAAMTLLAQFVEGQAQDLGNEQIGFFPFPYGSDKFNGNEVAPMEVLVVPTSTNKQEELTALLEFIIDYSAIDSLSYDLGWLSVSNQPGKPSALSKRMVVANKRASNATNFVQYFDRETTPGIAGNWASAIKRSMGTASSQPIKDMIKKKQFTLTDSAMPVEDSAKLLSLATVSGLKGGFLAARMLSSVYEKLGYDIAVSRFSSVEAAIKSIDYGSDGELVRVVDIPALDNKVIKVPEPLATTRIFLVGNDKHSCVLSKGKLASVTAEDKPTVSVVADTLRLNEWIEQLELKSIKKQSAIEAWRSLSENKIDYILAFETDVFSRISEVKNACFVSLETLPAYHYLSIKHADLVEQVKLGIIRIKQTEGYKQSLLDYGLGILPEKG